MPEHFYELTFMSSVRRANRASAAQLTRSIDPLELFINGKLLGFAVKTTSNLSDREREQIWNIFEDNMFQLYNGSSFGWNTHQKQGELFHHLSRFILVQEGSFATHETEPDHVPIVAYVMFRFERECSVNVAYCYEIQVSNEFRRCGLGKVLMRRLADIGATWGMQKLMLTVFKANVAALKFYDSLGFSMDETSPENVGDAEWVDEDALNYDYRIMSISLTVE